MTHLRLYADEDSMSHSLVAALQARSIDIRTALDDGMRGRPDIEQLRWATSQGRVLYSYNVADFCQLHAHFLNGDEQHTGIILAQQRVSIGDQMRGVLKLRAALTAEEMVNQLVF